MRFDEDQRKFLHFQLQEPNNLINSLWQEVRGMLGFDADPEAHGLQALGTFPAVQGIYAAQYFRGMILTYT